MATSKLFQKPEMEIRRRNLQLSAIVLKLKPDTPEKWRSILSLYDRLLAIKYSPIAELNRTYAFSKIHGKKRAVAEAEKLKLPDNHFYYILPGELYTDVDSQKATAHFEKALALAKTDTDKQTIRSKIEKLLS